MFEETFSQAWRLRYGDGPPVEVPELAPLLRHRSVRKFSDRPVPEETMQGLIAAAQSAATSSNLQLYSIVSVQEPERRENIAKLCADQDQIRDAAWFFAFLVDHCRLRTAAGGAGQDPGGLDYAEFYTMAVVDAALAAERMVCAAEFLGMGICYIGALRNDPEAIKELLKLPDGVFGVFGLCIGYPAEDSEAEIRPRLRQHAIWFREEYNADAETEEYDERMRSFYVSEGVKGAVTWSMRSGRRVDGFHMTGRETQKEWLEGQGFNRR